MDFLEFTIDGVKFHVQVSDAFLLIPIAPWLWPFFLFRWFDVGDESSLTLFTFCHIFGDFGTRGLPGTFKIVLVDVVVQMARSEMVLTLPLAVYVDDTGLIGPEADFTDEEAEAFHAWTESVCGIVWKKPKELTALLDFVFWISMFFLCISA